MFLQCGILSPVHQQGYYSLLHSLRAALHILHAMFGLPEVETRLHNELHGHVLLCIDALPSFLRSSEADSAEAHKRTC